MLNTPASAIDNVGVELVFFDDKEKNSMIYFMIFSTDMRRVFAMLGDLRLDFGIVVAIVA
jgi:hypothetical protein